jgi:hypothetical protein
MNTISRVIIILLAAVFVAFLSAIIFLVLMRILRIWFPRLILRNSVRRAAPYLVLGSVVGLSAAMLLGTDVLQEYSIGELGSGTDPWTQLLNLSVSVARSGGLALPLILVGLAVIAKRPSKAIGETFLTFSLLALIPTLSLRAYTGFYILPFLAIFGGLGLIGLASAVRKKPRAAGAVGLALVLGVTGFSVYVLQIEITRSTEMPAHTYSTGLYVLSLGEQGAIISNEGLTAIRVAAVSGARILPVGGAGTTFQSPELLAFHFYTADEVYERVIRIDIWSLTIESDSLWVASDIQAEGDWVAILQSLYGEIPVRLETRYQPTIYLEIQSYSGQFFAYGNVYCSDLGLSVHEDGYRIYDNGYEALWWLQTPDIEHQPTSSTKKCN